MPLHDLLQRLRIALTGSPPEDEAASVPMVPAAEYDASQALLTDAQRQLAVTEAEYNTTRTLLIETQRRLAVADQRIAILGSSNRTAARAIRQFLQDREQLVAEREAVEVRLSIAVGERSIAIADQQRTMILNDQLLSTLRDHEDARQHLEEENQRLRRRLTERTASVAVEADDGERSAAV
ncbi:hypothetical protein [Methylobacterium sp. R2-1]|uniref:hypothetical protein n=1 Tax=Methylobacterium sp. R2-1 TaxID=2587064 RepID=UPI001611262B|nr:hypothetical protein [Methylobacterium sp. R2-1]MBB2960865.1 cell shape-determining protein MreC [Methylobacterium sp. R2-1]